MDGKAAADHGAHQQAPSPHERGFRVIAGRLGALARKAKHGQKTVVIGAPVEVAG
jgi:hypothetical protein